MVAKSNNYWNSFLPIFFDRVSTLIRAHMTDIVDKYGLSSSHALYLVSLVIEGPMTQKELSKFLDLDVSNTNRVVKVLMGRGLVYEQLTGATSRNCKYALTKEGESIADEVMDEMSAWIDEQMSCIPQEDQFTVRDGLLKVLRKMDPGIDEYISSIDEDVFYAYLMTSIDGGEKGV